MFVLKRCRSWTKWDTYELEKTGYSFLCPALPTYLFLGLSLFFSDHLILPFATTDHPMSDLKQELSGIGHQIDMSKNQEQPLTPSWDIVGKDHPTNPSVNRLRLDQPATSSGDKGLEFSYSRPKLLFIISSKFVLPVSQIKKT